MKKFLFTLFVTISLFANSTVINVTAVGAGVDIRPNINTAVTAASAGDTVKIPAGTFRLDQTVTISKKISLIGSGIDTTILYRDESVSDATLAGWGSMFIFNINSRKASNITVSKITFKGQIPSFVTGDGGSMALDIGVKIVNAVDFVVHNCKFYGFGDSGLQIRHYDDLPRGLIFKCQFLNCSKGTLGLGFGYGLAIYGEGSRWVDAVQLGDLNAIYVEDCYFERSRHEVASAGGAQMVVRHNQFRKHIAVKSAHCIDTHQNRDPSTGGTNVLGTRRYEIYDNSIINTTYYGGVTPVVSPICEDSIQERAIGITNGDGVVFNDTIAGYRFGIGVVQSEDTTGTYPWYGQVGYASALRFGPSHTGVGRKGEGDLFYWNISYTTYSTTCGGPCSLFWNYDEVAHNGTGRFIIANRDYQANTVKSGYKAAPYPHPKRVKYKYY